MVNNETEMTPPKFKNKMKGRKETKGRKEKVNEREKGEREQRTKGKMERKDERDKEKNKMKLVKMEYKEQINEPKEKNIPLNGKEIPKIKNEMKG